MVNVNSDENFVIYGFTCLEQWIKSTKKLSSMGREWPVFVRDKYKDFFPEYTDICICVGRELGYSGKDFFDGNPQYGEHIHVDKFLNLCENHFILNSILCNLK